MAAKKKLLEEAHRRYAVPLTSFAFFRVHDKRLAEDLVQETFLKTWQYILKGETISEIRALLYRILHGLIVDVYRKKGTASLDAFAEKGFVPSVDPTESLFTFIDGSIVASQIGELPGIYGEVVRMRYLNEMSLGEISAKTGRNRAAVAVQVHRGLKKIKALLAT